jgi:hypothetical protein
MIVAGNDSSLSQQGFQGCTRLAAAGIHQWFSGNQDPLVSGWEKINHFPQSCPEQTLGPVPLDCIAGGLSCCDCKSGIWIVPSL